MNNKILFLHFTVATKVGRTSSKLLLKADIMQGGMSFTAREDGYFKQIKKIIR